MRWHCHHEVCHFDEVIAVFGYGVLCEDEIVLVASDIHDSAFESAKEVKEEVERHLCGTAYGYRHAEEFLKVEVTGNECSGKFKEGREGTEEGLQLLVICAVVFRELSRDEFVENPQDGVFGDFFIVLRNHRTVLFVLKGNTVIRGEENF